MSKPVFQHSSDTSEGRIERAVFILGDGEKQGMLVSATIAHLKRKGCTDSEITEALNQASNGALVATALGKT